jgi:peptidoglycan/LPS O-acetylase OafA/YrhL
MGVMLGHAFDLAVESTTHPSGIFFSIATRGRPYCGFICVVGFIVLSGYCIAASTARSFSVGRYGFMRVSRLYPLLAVAVLLTALVEWSGFQSPDRPHMWRSGIDATHFFIALAGLSGFNGQFGALAPSYTISFELMYYLVWGVAMVSAFARPRWALVPATLISVALIILNKTIRTGFADPAHFGPPLAIALLPVWLLGAALALFEKPLIRGTRVIPVWTGWIITGAAFTYALRRFDKPRSVGVDYGDILYFMIMSLLFVIAVAAWLARPSPPENRADTWLGEISYPLFLAHGPVIIGSQLLMNRLGFQLPFEAALTILIVASFLAAAVLAAVVERPVMAWRRWVKQRAPKARLAAKNPRCREDNRQNKHRGGVHHTTVARCRIDEPVRSSDHLRRRGR